MNIVRWDPFRNFLNLADRSLPGLFEGDVQTAWLLAIDVFEKDDRLVIRAELPGVERDDIDVRVEDGELVLSGERKRDESVKEENAYRLERVYGSFSRRFRLADSLDATKVTARYENGVLEIAVPRSEQAKPRKVEIKVA